MSAFGAASGTTAGGLRARDAGAVIVPEMAFFGGLGDLPATAATGDRTAAVSAHIAHGPSHRHRTAGTRLSGAVSRERRGAHRLGYAGGRWERRTGGPGQDVHAVIAPLVVEAPVRVLTGRIRTVGVASAGALFDAPGFLRAPSPHLTFETGV